MKISKNHQFSILYKQQHLGMDVKAISCMFILMILANAQYFLLLKRKLKTEPVDSTSPPYV